MNCDFAGRQILPLLYGELSFDEEEAVQGHLEQCGACQTEAAQLRNLHAALDTAALELPSGLLDNCRNNLRLELAEVPLPAKPPSFWERAQMWFGTPQPTWMKAAGALALLFIGFGVGRGYDLPVTPRETQPTATRVRYVQPEDDGNVQIVLEEVRQRTLEGGLNDNRIRALLVSAARDAADPGVRVETVDLLKASTGVSDVRMVLTAALQHDPNPGVRLKALEALRTSARDPEVRRVLAKVLLTDDNPGVRTQAIDLLVQQREASIVGVLQELMATERNSYVRLKCERALSDMNASVETF